MGLSNDLTELGLEAGEGFAGPVGQAGIGAADGLRVLEELSVPLVVNTATSPTLLSGRSSPPSRVRHGEPKWPNRRLRSSYHIGSCGGAGALRTRHACA